MEENMKNTKEELATYLKALREAEGLTQQEAAERAGLSVAFLSLIENGRQTPSAKSLVRIAQAYPSADGKELLRTFGYSENLIDMARPHRAALRAPTVDKSAWATSLASATVEQREDGEHQGIPDLRLDWALFCIVHDPEYSLAEGWQELPTIAKALTVRVYQLETGRMLLTNEETAAINGLVHGKSKASSDEAG
jgi:transcriptional regulator with XRE-family HTH domain